MLTSKICTNNSNKTQEHDKKSLGLQLKYLQCNNHSITYVICIFGLHFAQDDTCQLEQMGQLVRNIGGIWPEKIFIIINLIFFL